MHLLICIGGEQYSRDTLRLGASLVRVLKADVTILYVRPAVSLQFRTEARVAREKLQDWPVETEDALMMKALQRIMEEQGLVRMVDGKPGVLHSPRVERAGLSEYQLYGAAGESLRIRVREGDVVQNIRRETMEADYTLVVIGAPGHGGRLVRHIIQYIDPSVLIVKNPREVESYRMLLCLNDSAAALKAQDFAVRTALMLGTPVDLLCIHSYPWEENGAMNLAEDTRRLFKRFDIPHTIRIRRGAVVRAILKEAQPEHLIVMGTSERSSIYQFMFGSVPVEIGRRGKNTVLVVK
jgi:nucleotide-binding universal stress UspA family protein